MRRNQKAKGRHFIFFCLVAGVCWLSFAFAQGEWKQALPGYQFDFNRDHASHPEHKI